jgi:hypothetical protein
MAGEAVGRGSSFLEGIRFDQLAVRRVAGIYRLIRGVRDS